MKDKKLIFRKFLRIAGGLLVAVLVCNINWGLDWPLYDLVFKLKGKQKPSPDIVLVGVDDRTLKELNELWPVSVDEYSEMLKNICREKPAVIGFDIVFDYEVGSKQEYERLANIVNNMKCKTLWGRPFAKDQSILEEIPKELPYSDIHIFNEFKKDGKDPKEHNNYVRRVTPYYHNGRELIKTLAFKSAEIFLNKNLVEDERRWYEFLTDYAGPAGTYEVISMIDVIRGNFPENYFTNKIVFVGGAEKTNHANFIRTPYYSGGKIDSLRIEVHANITNTILENSLINKSYVEQERINIVKKNNTYAVLATYLLCVFTVFILFGTTPLTGIAIVLGQILFLLAIGIVSLRMRNYVSMIQPLLGVFISYYLLIPYRLVSEYRRRWEYQEANKILSEVERMKSNFLSLITHDLKTPIARIQGLAESFLRENGKDLKEESEKPLKAIIKNSEELNSFISRILNLSRIEASEVKLNLTSRDLNSLINETLEKFKYILKEHSINTKLELEPLFSIKMDDQLIGQVLYNLIDNAIKYSDSGTTITVKSFERDEKAFVSISDQGIGVSGEDQKNMFTKFYRIKDAKKADVKGSGLGLYLVKYFVELHGGKITIESEPSKGSTFTFYLPVS